MKTSSSSGTCETTATRMQLTYTLPPGEYALIDFDQNMTDGRPEALEGMYVIATLR
jgi:hypothetical protein